MSTHHPGRLSLADSQLAMCRSDSSTLARDPLEKFQSRLGFEDYDLSFDLDGVLSGSVIHLRNQSLSALPRMTASVCNFSGLGCSSIMINPDALPNDVRQRSPTHTSMGTASNHPVSQIILVTVLYVSIHYRNSRIQPIIWIMPPAFANRLPNPSSGSGSDSVYSQAASSTHPLKKDAFTSCEDLHQPKEVLVHVCRLAPTQRSANARVA